MDDKEQNDILSSSVGRLFKVGGLAGKIGLSMLGNTTAGIFRGEESKGRKKEENWFKNAERLVSTLGEMKGGVMKVGQMLSLQEGILPKEFTNVLSMLQKEAPPVSFATLEKVIASNVPDYKEKFSDIDPKPYAAASIGQVHRAKLKDGKDVVLKVQYPDMEKVIKSDIKNLRTVFNLIGSMMFKMDLNKVWDEMEKQLIREVDYELELTEQLGFRKSLADIDWVQVPEPYAAYSGKQVLCSEFMPGETLQEVIEGRTQDERDAWGENLYRLSNWQVFALQMVQSDPNAANYAFLPGGKIIMYDFGNVKHLPVFLVNGYRDIIAAFLDQRVTDIPGILKTIGLHYHDGRMIEQHIVTDYVSLFTTVFNSNDYRFHPDSNLVGRLIEMGRKHIFDSFGVVFPPDTIFVDRSIGGLFGNLTRLKAQATWRDILLGTLDDTDELWKEKTAVGS